MDNATILSDFMAGSTVIALADNNDMTVNNVCVILRSRIKELEIELRIDRVDILAANEALNRLTDRLRNLS